MVVNGPEILDSVESGHGATIVLPLLALFVFEEPQCPSEN